MQISLKGADMPNWLFSFFDTLYVLFFHSSVERENRIYEEARRTRRIRRADRRTNAAKQAEKREELRNWKPQKEKPEDVSLTQRHVENQYAWWGVKIENEPIAIEAINGHPRFYKVEIVPLKPRDRKSMYVFTYVECRDTKDSATILMYRPWSRIPYKGYWFHGVDTTELNSFMVKRIFAPLKAELEV